MNYGRLFKRARERSGLSQKEAAEKIGVKSYQLANYETDRSEPSLDVLVKMSRVYQVSIDYMLFNTKLQQNYGNPNFEDDAKKENERLYSALKNLMDRFNHLDSGGGEEDK